MAVTVGIVAGLINAGVIFLQLTFPLLIVFLLVALLPSENNAITWSVVGRQLQGSFWPLILRADSTSSSKVQARVLIFSLGSTLGLLLLAAAAIVTPLGLYESETDGRLQNTTFMYAQDVSPIGMATRPRDEYRTSRLCTGTFSYVNCPGQEHGFSFYTNASGYWVDDKDDASWISSVPPANLSEIFSSGRDGNFSTVASALDIQYRSYSNMATPDATSVLGLGSKIKWRIDQYRKRTVGQFTMFQSHILADDYVIVDGMVADMKRGGVGFRNHTLPVHSGQGAEWTETLLWMEPETVCVDLNLTYKWKVLDDRKMKHTIIDNGGFVDLSRQYPYLDLNYTQTKPELQGRAYKGGMLFNWDLMKYFNTSRNTSSIGQSYTLPTKVDIMHGQVMMSRFSNSDTSFQLGPDSLSVPRGTNSSEKPLIAPQVLVWGVGGGDYANLTHITIDGGVIVGAPSSDDGADQLYRVEPGTTWKAPLYSCVSTLKVYLMDVTFTINNTKSLANLAVKHAEPRKYSSNATTPLWAVENTGSNISQISPLWGMVDNKYENAPNLWTIRQESLYLPAGQSQYWGGLGELARSENDAWAAELPQAVLTTVYANALDDGSSGGIPDYSGAVNYPLYLRWREYTKSTATTGRIISLIWTDIMMNLVTSSRSRLTTSGKDTTNEGASADLASIDVPAFVSSHVIKYHMAFAIPGLIFLIIYLLIVTCFVFMLCFKRATFSTLRSLANQTAVGRAMTIERYNGRHEVRAMTTKTWIELHGDSDLMIRKHVPTTTPNQGNMDEERSNNEVELTSPLVPKSDSPWIQKQ